MNASLASPVLACDGQHNCEPGPDDILGARLSRSVTAERASCTLGTRWVQSSSSSQACARGPHRVLPKLLRVALLLGFVPSFPRYSVAQRPITRQIFTVLQQTCQSACVVIPLSIKLRVPSPYRISISYQYVCPPSFPSLSLYIYRPLPVIPPKAQGLFTFVVSRTAGAVFTRIPCDLSHFFPVSSLIYS